MGSILVKNYDEIANRPSYKTFLNVQNGIKTEETLKETNGLYQLHSLPYLITKNEFAQIEAGIKQRAETMQSFLKDLFSGEKTYQKLNLFPKGLEEAVFERWDIRPEFVNPDLFSSVYGPDLIKNHRGDFVILEDNMTVVTGVPFIEHNKNIINKNYSHLNKLFYQKDSYSFVEKLESEFRKRCVPKNGKIIFLNYSIPRAVESISGKARMYAWEQKRYTKVLRDVGIETVSVNHLSKSGGWDPVSKKRKSLVVKSDGVYFVTKSFFGKVLSEEPVGFVFMDICTDHIFKWAIPGLAQAYKENKVGLSHSPGIDLFNDKIWYPFFNNLIQFYKNEKPILETIPSLVFGDQESLEKVSDENFNKVFSDLENWVIKYCNGCGGSSVWIGREVANDSKLISKLKRDIRKSPWEYLAQKYIPSSHLDNIIVDVRPITYVGPDKIFVSQTPWSRGIPMNQSLKHNLGANVGNAVHPIVKVIEG